MRKQKLELEIVTFSSFELTCNYSFVIVSKFEILRNLRSEILLPPPPGSSFQIYQILTLIEN